MVNNADWLLKLNYVDFLRDVGIHFSVNRMLTAECYKNRMEKGLTFLEFNYMIMQAYDFYVLHQLHNCKMQFGGNDQWSNIIAGTDLIRRKDSASAYGMTFSLLTNSEGKKMGKTEKGALWLDPEKTSPYDFYQYWRNVDDADVKKCLSLLTFLPMEEVERLSAFEGSEINKAKEVLAFEVTQLIHGTENAKNAEEASKALFGKGQDLSNVPTIELDKSVVENGIEINNLLADTKIVSTKSEGRRLIQQNGIYLNDDTITTHTHEVTLKDFSEGFAMIRKGKKKYFKLIIK